MPQSAFELACDRLSHAVDPAQHKRLQWDRNEGPMLESLVALAVAALEQRSEFELAEEGAIPGVKRFVLKVHSKRIVAIAISLEGREVCLTAEPIDRSNYRIAAGPPVRDNFDIVDQAWMGQALQTLFDRVQAGAG